MNLKTTLAALRTGWHLVFIAVLVACAAAVWIESSSQPVFSADASYIISPGSGIEPDDVARGLDTLDSSSSRSIMATLTEITDSDGTRTQVFASLGLDQSLSEDYLIESVVVPEANVMQTTVTGPDPDIAAELASTLGVVGGARFVESYQIYDVEVLDPALIPTEPSNPGLTELLVIAAAMGLIAGGALALLRSAFLQRSGGGMNSRLGAYDSRVTRLEERKRLKRVG
jgi:uncharacterized protein involved in exopolysaccharide biosynthesis